MLIVDLGALQHPIQRSDSYQLPAELARQTSSCKSVVTMEAYAAWLTKRLKISLL